MIAVGDDERACVVAAQQQDRRQRRAGRGLAQVGRDVLVVLAEQGELAGPQEVLGLAVGDVIARGGQLAPVLGRPLGRHDQRQVVLRRLIVVLLRLRQPLHRLRHAVPS
jgi:hypothetical protein